MITQSSGDLLQETPCALAGKSTYTKTHRQHNHKREYDPSQKSILIFALPSWQLSSIPSKTSHSKRLQTCLVCKSAFTRIIHKKTNCEILRRHFRTIIATRGRIKANLGIHGQEQGTHLHIFCTNLCAAHMSPKIMARNENNDRGGKSVHSFYRLPSPQWPSIMVHNSVCGINTTQLPKPK